MQITSKFTAAVHILTCIEVFGGEMRVTSDFLSGSTGVNAVIVRNVLGQLRQQHQGNEADEQHRGADLSGNQRPLQNTAAAK